MARNKKTRKTFIISAAAISLFIWQFMFNLGAYNTVFFENILSVWILSLALLTANLWLPKKERLVGGKKLWALSLPTIWFVMTLVSQYTGNDIVGQIVFWTGSLVMLLGLPYVAYTILVITQEEAIALKSRLQIGLFVISLTVGGLGYVIGKNHHLLISCDDFRLSGNYVPENCADIDEL